jgi:DNA-directed RNA polymerase subunit RPC12/RpoP
MKKLLEWLKNVFNPEYHCSDCKIKMDTYGSEPWGYFYYVCAKCKKETHPSANER